MSSDLELGDEYTRDNEEEEANGEARDVDYHIINYPADTTLSGYKQQLDTDQLRIPQFQRGYIWDIKRASKLIESFLLGLPVPGVFLFRPNAARHSEVIDGQQRISASVDFLRGEFTGAGSRTGRTFRLVGVQKRYLGKSIDTLSEEDRFRVENAVLRATIIQQISPDNNASVYHIFERLNTGGVNLNPMEVRQAVSEPRFIDFLKELNRLPEWRRIIGRPDPDPRLQDVELLLRCLALSDWMDQYEKPMKDFLNLYSEKMRKEIDRFPALRLRFAHATQAIVQHLGDRPFHLYGRLNYAALDAVIGSALKWELVDDAADKFAELKSNKDFIESIRFSTSDISVIRKRHEATRVLVNAVD